MTKQRGPHTTDTAPIVVVPSPEVQPAVERQPRSAAEKLRILQEYDSYSVGSPERGAVLRREGIYTSQISKWRKRLASGGAVALQAQPRGPKPDSPALVQAEVARLRAENARLQARLAHAESIIEIQKKLSQLLGTTLPGLPTDER